MTYRIVYAPSFRDDLDQHIDYLLTEKVAITTIERWLTELCELIDSLDRWPNRFPIDPIQTQAAGQETRKLNVDDYLVFYQVDDEHRQVNVVAFIHCARYRPRKIENDR